MKIKSIAKKISAMLAAALCCTVISGTVSAAESKTVWKDAMAVAGATYNAGYIKAAEQLSAKESKYSVTFGKSRTKKFYEKYYAAMNADKLDFKYCYTDEKSVIMTAVKGGYAKFVIYGSYDDEELVLAAIETPKKEIGLNIKEKTKKTTAHGKNYDSAASLKDILGSDYSDINTDLGISDGAKGKLFKFKYKGKSYYYEEFTTESGERTGYMFTADGDPVAITADGKGACCGFSFSVDDSEFTVPEGYKESK